MNMLIPCIKCKGRNPENCGRAFCPITAKAEAMFKVKQAIKEDIYSASPPTPFIGRFGYPFVNIGILSPPEHKEDSWLYDSPHYWSEQDFDIKKIVELRSSLINSRFKAEVKDAQANDKLIGISQEIGMADKPVDVEIKIDKPRFKFITDASLAPMGPSANLKKVEITSSPKIHTKVDKVVSDTDLKANEAINYLYKSDFNENFLSKLLSVGTLGLKKNRKFVPTRWSITATDDIIAKKLMEDVKQYNEIDYCSYFGSYLGNYYLLLFFPDVWQYELFETYMPQSSWNITNKVAYTTDYENYNGRKTYAENCAGGYYTVRLAILEKLNKLKKQASVLALRFITGDYTVPLGVWVTRQATRKALTNKPIFFEDKSYMLNYANKLIRKYFNYDVDNLLKESVILKNVNQQSKLNKFLF